MKTNKLLAYILFSAYSFIVNFSFFFLPLYLKTLHFQGTQIGVLMMLFAITAILFSFKIGILDDKYGSKTNLCLGFFLMIVFYAGLLLFKRFELYLLIFLLGGFGGSTLRVTLNSMFFKLVNPETKGKEIGIFNSLFLLFMALGMLLGSLLLQYIGYENVFKISIILFSVLFMISFKIATLNVSIFETKSYLKDLFRKEVFWFSVIILLFTSHWGAETTIYSLFLENRFSLSIPQIGLFMGIPILFLGISSYFFGVKNDDNLSNTKILILSVILSGTGLILFATVKNIYLAFLFRIIHEVGDGAFMVSSFVNIVKLFPNKRLGGNTGSMMVVMILGQSIGSYFFGFLSESYGYSIPLIIAGLFIFLPLFILTNSKKKESLTNN